MRALLIFMESRKKRSDLLKYSITFWVFNGIKFYGRRVRKLLHENKQKMENIEHFTKSLIYFFQVLIKISFVLIIFQPLSNGPLLCVLSHFFSMERA